MKPSSAAICFFAILSLHHGTVCSTYGPYLSSPGSGSASILVFLDLHRSYNGDTCADPDWDIFELAQSLQWRSNQEQQTGIEIYDTCSSQRRVFNIVRQRLETGSCTADTLPSIAGILSHSTQVINDILTNNFNNVHIVVENGEPTESNDKRIDGQMFVQLASKSNVKMLSHIMQRLNWTYVTTFSDNHPLSRLEHTSFQHIADDLNICIQYSQNINNWVSEDIVPIKTDGVVIFVNDLSDIKSIIEKLPKSTAVAIATHDRRTSEFRFINRGIVLSDAFIHIPELAEYMTTSLWNQTIMSDLSVQYYLTKHNCSIINQSVAEKITCSGIENMRAHFNIITSFRRMHVFQETLSLVTRSTEYMVNNSCSKFSRDCFDGEVVKSSSSFVIGANQTLLWKPPYNITLTLLSGGTVQKVDTFSTTNFTDISPDISTWIDGASGSFPTSLCSTWCPSCRRYNYSFVSNQLSFDGDYVYIPGDILIAGMVPLSQHWLMTSSNNVCSGMLLESNIDVRSEAFLYAVMSSQSRHTNMLQGLSIGAILFDTCSDNNRALQILLNFESGRYDFKLAGNNWKPEPAIVPVYVYLGSDETIISETTALQKLIVGVNDDGNMYGNDRILYDSAAYDFKAVVEFLQASNLSYVGLITSAESNGLNIQELFKAARSKNICISYHSVISSENSGVIDIVIDSPANVVIIFAKSGDVNNFFRSLTTRPVVKTWILMETREHWIDISAFPLPLGSVIFSCHDKQNQNFNQHINDVLNNSPVNFTTNNPWIEKYKQARSVANVPSPIPDAMSLIQSSDVIRAVDITLDAIEKASKSICGNSTGLCPEFLSRGAERSMQEFEKEWFVDQEEATKRSTASRMYNNYIISNLQTDGIVEVGRWIDQHLLLDQENVRSYDSKGSLLPEFRDSYCFITPCSCININTTANQSDFAELKQLDYEMGFMNSSGKFQKELWAIIVVIVAGTGSLLTLLLMTYIMCKVCAGALVRRYLALGILLLIGIIFLLLSVLPFVFTPNEYVCGLRFFSHGFSYAFCFGIMLTKMMTLRDYKNIGLGGDISRINQLMSVFFITSVQIAIGVQWWVMKTTVVYNETKLEVVNDRLQETTYYACDFVRKEFLSYHCYVIFLLILCCLYSVSVRKETKNMKEARLLLVCSWFCLVLWIGIVATFVILDRKYLEAICAIGILANALSMVVIIYLPKLNAISRLKYEVSEHAHKENGYKLDPDFQFERPYSLPGTLHSSITDKALTYPRSLATFDTSLSY